jgi:hypothetical protein
VCNGPVDRSVSFLVLALLAAGSSGCNGVAACVAGQSCTPASADPCRTYATTCNAASTQSSCAVAGEVADRTSCGTGLVCVAGQCGPAIRTVSGTFQTTYWPDAGTKTTLSSPPPYGKTAKAILVPDASVGGYTTLPITLRADQSFSIPNVPAGPYFLQLDHSIFPPCQSCPGGGSPAVSTELIELRANSPDLTIVTGARVDLAYRNGPFLRLDVAGLAPWTSGSSVRTASSQALQYGRLSPSPTLAAGATSAGGVWIQIPAAFPDASKGDVVFVHQLAATPIGSGATAGTASAATRYARLTTLTLSSSSSGATITLTDSAPQTGAIHADFRNAQFAALAASVHPSAVPAASGAGASVQAVPHSIQYPDMPFGFEQTTLFVVESYPARTADIDYGTLHYGEFLDAYWNRYRYSAYAFDADVPGGGEIALPAQITSMVPMTPDPGPIAPAVGPPTQPRIEGRDAFATQTGVGLQPTITWSPPALGQATSYQVTISRRTQPVIAGETRTLSAVIYSGRAFQVPGGFLQRGSYYSASITARSGPWDVFDRGPFRKGTPFHTAECYTGYFTP